MAKWSENEDIRNGMWVRQNGKIGIAWRARIFGTKGESTFEWQFHEVDPLTGETAAIVPLDTSAKQASIADIPKPRKPDTDRAKALGYLKSDAPETAGPKPKKTRKARK